MLNRITIVFNLSRLLFDLLWCFSLLFLSHEIHRCGGRPKLSLYFVESILFGLRIYRRKKILLCIIDFPYLRTTNLLILGIHVWTCAKLLDQVQIDLIVYFDLFHKISLRVNSWIANFSVWIRAPLELLDRYIRYLIVILFNYFFRTFFLLWSGFRLEFLVSNDDFLLLFFRMKILLSLRELFWAVISKLLLLIKKLLSNELSSSFDKEFFLLGWVFGFVICVWDLEALRR